MSGILRKKVREQFRKYRLNRLRRWAIDMEKIHINKVKLLNLSEVEVNEIKSQWGDLGLSINFLYYRLFKTLVGFDSKYLSDDLFYPWMIRSLNPLKDSSVYENKGGYDLLFPHLLQPQCFVKNFNGQFFDGDRNCISCKESIELLMNLNEDLIIKPIIDSSCGRNVRKIFYSSEQETACREEILEKLFLEYRSNFIIQEVVEQAEETALFNPGSLNTIRMTSLNLNGKTSILSSIFRCGQNNNIVDNAGAGGLVVGLNQDGYLNQYAYDADYRKYDATISGVTFYGKQIPNFDILKEVVKINHSKFLPTCGFVGWDFALNKNHKPVLIEVNLGFPGIQMEQLCTGPILGERTNEVIEYVKKFPPEVF